METKQLQEFLLKKAQDKLDEIVSKEPSIEEEIKEPSIEELKQQKNEKLQKHLEEINKILVSEDVDNKFLLERTLLKDTFKVDLQNFNSLNYILESIKSIRETKEAYERNVKAIKKLDELLTNVAISTMDLTNTKNIVESDKIFELKSSNKFDSSGASNDAQLINKIFETGKNEEILDVKTSVVINAVKLKKEDPELYNKHVVKTLSINIKETN